MGSYPGTDIDPEIVNIVVTISLLFWVNNIQGEIELISFI